MKRITARETKARVDALVSDLPSLYRGSIINKRGRANGAELPYGEIVAKRLLHTHNIPQLFTQLPKVAKGVDFRPTDHDGTMLNPTILGLQQESRVAVALYNHRVLGTLGKVIDYHVPVQPEGRDIGMIDLVSFNASTSTLFVIGFTYHEERRDTLLRCALEIATLRNSIEEQWLVRSYAEALLGEDGEPVDPRTVAVEAAVLLLEGSYQDRSIRALKRMPHVADLINALDIRVFTIGVDLQLADRPRFTRKQALYPYKPVFHFIPVLRERPIIPS
jgi:hypothetical protein